jgi:7,8-dihydropterin-6-yl-methyl-4-(beta-D-ribofuranosyl)aminobenzene 5'-phosphate synthase
MVVATALASLLIAIAARGEEPKRITILYDAFGQSSSLVMDWGFSAFVEYGGKRILFDTGNDADIFEHNVERLGVDLRKLDAVIVSHRHGDHTSGLAYLLEVNPSVEIYTPAEGAFFKSKPPAAFLEPQPGLPPDLRYYGGKPPERWVSGTPWETANFKAVTTATEVSPGFHVLTTRSQKPGTLEMNELSLAIQTPKGLAVIVGCSHPGVEKILEEAAKIDSKVFTVIGGFHLVLAPREEVQRTADALHNVFKVDRIAPGHCTSELGFAVFLDRFKERFDHAGLGTTISLP